MANRTSLTVIQLNDSHAYFDLHQEVFWLGGQAAYRPAGGYARIATLVKQIRAANQERVLFCDCGDTLHGTYPAQNTKGQAMVPILNALGLDAMTAHWEFAYGPAAFHQRATELSYPMLAINIYDQATKERFFPPYSVKEIGGLRIGLVGVACNIIDKTMPPSFSEGVEFTLGREELPSSINDLRTKEKVDLVVLISHLGFPQDMKLLSEVEGIDVCLSGHTHNRLYKPMVIYDFFCMAAIDYPASDFQRNGQGKKFPDTENNKSRGNIAPMRRNRMGATSRTNGLMDCRGQA